MNSFYTSSTNMGLKINIGKTEVQVISKKDMDIDITINCTKLKQVNEFIYLGGKISQKGSCTEDIKHRIGKALGVFQNLKDIWASKISKLQPRSNCTKPSSSPY